MKNLRRTFLLTALFTLLLSSVTASETADKISGAQQINPTTIDLLMESGRRITLDFYADNIFRLFCDPKGGMMRAPEATPQAQILVDNPRTNLSKLEFTDENGIIYIRTARMEMIWNKATALFSIIDLSDNVRVAEQAGPLSFTRKEVVLTLREQPGEYFYGGGVQNGRFSHKGESIAIENESSWTDGGVASPAPFYWSTGGYGFMAYTFKEGRYDFGAAQKGVVKIAHNTTYADFFFMVNATPVALLNDYYQLTGNPVLLPKFGFYEGHLNAYNRDYWVENNTSGRSILFEDGKSYLESQKNKEGILESLNGEKENYQFSARAVIDRYAAHDMPFGWLLPNDGYGAGYGQTETLDGNIQNLKSLTDYAHSKGVEIGLWTQSNLHPNPDMSALLQRDIIKEVRDAGVRVLKTDVAWVGPGYSFGLNGIADASSIMSYYGNDARPFIITLDGWAGTQRYAGVWSGDQTGGQWEYIRFHIPTYIGSGLSGMPNITSDMDGIFGGNKPVINVRDFQWKTFTPMELNMDGWGDNEKYPHAMGEPYTSINRWYLKLKSQLMPYTYSIARESVDGKPLIRAMFLDYPNKYTLGKATQYQYLYGPYFLVAPIYQETACDSLGNDLRNGIYLPEGEWIDYFSGRRYSGGVILNRFDAPLWKLPLFVKEGAIIPMTNPNNNVSEIDNTHRIYEIYPAAQSSFTEYDDDGTTRAYQRGEYVTTLIESVLDKKGRAVITLNATKGHFNGFVNQKSTELRINLTDAPKKVTAKQGKQKIALKQAANEQELANGTNMYYYDAAPRMNTFATKGSSFEQVQIIKNPVLYVKLAKSDITRSATTVTIDGYSYRPASANLTHTGSLVPPANVVVTEADRTPFTLTPTWNEVANVDYYEIEFDGMVYSNITNCSMQFEGLTPQTEYSFKLRALNRDGVSEWTTITATTSVNPLQYALQGVTAETNVPNQGGQGTDKLFNFDENDTWHTRWETNALPFELTIDLQSINTLDKLHYLPRPAGNGIILRGSLSISNDKMHWERIDTIDWAKNGDTKVYTFATRPQARYIRFSVTDGVGGFGSGRELYIFKVPGSKSVLQGDINDDGFIDSNDLTSYMNYTGLRRGDSDFDGYIVKGDINGNGLIDAYDISVVATRLAGGVGGADDGKMRGSLQITADKDSYTTGEVVTLTVSGQDLAHVNALSFALPYNPQDYEYTAIETTATHYMENLTTDRLHTNGEKVLYPTFVNKGYEETLEGSAPLFVIKLKARRNVKFGLKAERGILVDRKLNCIDF